MITVDSPRIHNLGDFAHCLPALSGLYKKTGEEISFGICDRLQRFKGIKELLLNQEMFGDVYFMSERPMSTEPYLIVDDHGDDSEENINAMADYRNVNYLNKHYNLDIKIDNDFELNVPELDIDYCNDKFLVGDRWSPSDAPDVDDRRKSNLLKSSGLFDDDRFKYLDYSNDLVYNCSLIKYNNKPLITTITGISVIADLMGKETYVLWDDDLRFWQGFTIEQIFRLHFSKNRDCKLVYVKDFDIEKI